jgi:Flp pilus assembly protein TadG
METNMPGFTAVASLAHASKHASRAVLRQNEPDITDARTGRQAVTPQFVGSYHCSWQCYPGSGCEYVCQFHPF